MRHTEYDWLHQHYVVEGMSCSACGKLCDPPFTGATIHYWLKKHGIKPREVGHNMKGDKNPRLGKDLPESTKKKISASLTGKKRSAESIRKQSRAVSGKNSHHFGKPRTHGKGMWVTRISDGARFYMRSTWEIRFAEHMSVQGHDWKYEPETLILCDGSAYTPDFLIDGVYYEVKGWVGPRTKAKLRLFSQTFPDKRIVLADRQFLTAQGIALGDDKLNNLIYVKVSESAKRQCPQCHKWFLPRRKSSKYCSTACNGRKPKKPKAQIKCQICGRIVQVYPSQAKTQRACSKKCGDILGLQTRSGRNHGLPCE